MVVHVHCPVIVQTRLGSGLSAPQAGGLALDVAQQLEIADVRFDPIRCGGAGRGDGQFGRTNCVRYIFPTSASFSGRLWRFSTLGVGQVIPFEIDGESLGLAFLLK
jgi:hypothetical protein